MTFVILRKQTLQDQIRDVIRKEVRAAFLAALQGDGTGDDRGVLGEFDSLHSRIRSLQLEIRKMQTRIDAFRELIAALDRKVDEWKARPEGVPVAEFDALADQLRAVLAKFG
jgi:hypothetical protein